MIGPGTSRRWPLSVISNIIPTANTQTGVLVKKKDRGRTASEERLVSHTPQPVCTFVILSRSRRKGQAGAILVIILKIVIVL